MDSTKRPNQSLEHNRWPLWIKAEGRIMKDEMKTTLAPASGGSARSR
jgi:hypothetical protein